MGSDTLLQRPTLSQLQALVGGVPVANVAGYEGYAVTADGDIWSCRVKRCAKRWQGWHKMKLRTATNGYSAIMLSANGKPRTINVHRIVMAAFAGPCPSGHEVCHNNSIKTDNRFSNLRYDTRSGNSLDKVDRGTCLTGEQNGQSKLTSKSVANIRQRYRNGGVLMRELAGEFGITRSAIGKLIRGETWKHLLQESA